MSASFAREPADVAPGSLVLSAVVGVSLAAAGFAIGMGAAGVTGETTSYWYLSRASGFVAYLLLWGSVVWGLLISTAVGRRWTQPALLADAHQFLSAAGIGFASFHSLILMGDRYASFPLAAVVVPFAAAHAPLLVACGQLAIWISVALVGSFHVRRRIGGRTWRRLHYAGFAAFWLALVHGLLLGTDGRTFWAAGLYLGTGAAVVFLTAFRVLAARGLNGLLVKAPAASRA